MKSYNRWHQCKEKCHAKCPEDSVCNFEECSDMMDHHHHQHQHCHPKEDECCHVPKMKMKCTPTKECVKTYKCCYKLYRFTQYRLFKVCTGCGHEFDHYHHGGMCPKCR